VGGGVCGLVSFETFYLYPRSNAEGWTAGLVIIPVALGFIGLREVGPRRLTGGGAAGGSGAENTGAHVATVWDKTSAHSETTPPRAARSLFSLICPFFSYNLSLALAAAGQGMSAFDLRTLAPAPRRFAGGYAPLYLSKNYVYCRVL
jgi:hypothetical protein